MDIGIHVPKILLPKHGVDLSKWAVVACDQYTSQQDYWDAVENIVGNAPSTLRLMLPEIYLGKAGEEEKIKRIQDSMEQYVSDGTLVEHKCFVYVERNIKGKIRKGLIVALDLEKYDYNKGSTTLTRATEGTIIERLPPRIKVREHASIELPHIMVLIDDPNRTVIEPLAHHKQKVLYDVELMQHGGHLAGFAIDDEKTEQQIIHALEKLADPVAFKQRYHKDHPLLFAVGDGNHSLATAKAVWENYKHTHSGVVDHPSRYALIELVNVHDEALVFEPIHRVLFHVSCNLQKEMEAYFGKVQITQVGKDDMVEHVLTHSGATQAFGFIEDGKYYVVVINDPKYNLTVATLQPFLDHIFKEKHYAKEIDYVHGTDVVCDLGAAINNAGFFLPPMSKSEFFDTVIIDGALPRKTFSMGEAEEKRYYMESRKIV